MIYALIEENLNSNEIKNYSVWHLIKTKNRSIWIFYRTQINTDNRAESEEHALYLRPKVQIFAKLYYRGKTRFRTRIPFRQKHLKTPDEWIEVK